MKLFYICKSCKTETFLKSSAATRPDLEDERGIEFNQQCSNCLVNSKVHVNEVRATENNMIIIAGAGVAILVTIFLWTFLGAIGTISIVIPTLIWKAQSGAVHNFNKYLVRR